MTEKTEDLIVGVVSGLLGGTIAGGLAGLLGMNLFSLILLTLFLTGAAFAIVRLIIILWHSR